MRKTMLFWFYNEKDCETVAASSAENAVRKYQRQHNIKGDSLLIRMLGSDMAEPRSNRQKSANAVVIPPSAHIRGSAYPMSMTLIRGGK